MQAQRRRFRGSCPASGLADIAFKLEQMGVRGRDFRCEGPLLTQLNDEVRRRCIDYLPTVRAALAKSTEA